MAIRVYLSQVLKELRMTSKELCAKVGVPIWVRQASSVFGLAVDLVPAL